MPFLPHQWNTGDPVSPTNLNTSLYSFLDANPIYPTGIQFHARKPIYKAVANTAVSVGAGVTAYPFQGQGAANVVIDSSGDYGAQLDPPQWGVIESTLPAATGTTEVPGGGWFLLSAFVPVGPVGANGDVMSVDIQESGVPTSWGQNDIGANTLPVTPWTADLFSLGTATWTPVAHNSTAIAYPTVVSSEGFQRSVYFQGLWVTGTSGVSPSLSPPAPKQNWSAGDQWTSQWANGPAGLVNVLEYLNYPPCMRADCAATTTSLANETATVVKLPETSLDTWGAYNDTTYTWTCPADGLYLVTGIVVVTAAVMSLQCSARINGTDYWGPSNYCTGTFAGTAMKAQVFSLLKGDTVQLAAYQDSGSTLATITSHEPRLVIAWVGQPGVPGLVNANPYFSQGSLTGWNGFGGALAAVSQAAVSGAPYPWVASFTPNSTQAGAAAEESSAAFTATPGAWYGVSAWVNPSGTQSVTVGFDWVNSGTYVSTSAATVTAGTGTWSLVHTIQQAPGSGINSGYPRVGRSAGTAVVPAAAQVYIAGVQAGQAGGTQPSPPDLTYKYTAGTPGTAVAAVFNDHLANDLAFLAWRPYLLSYQTVTQTVNNNFSTPVTMDTVTGIVHGDYGDNYGGWSAGSNDWYTAQAAGWYLVVVEVFVNSNSGASYPMVQAGIEVSSAPSAHFDFYELHVVPASPAADVPGAAAMGLYYLNEGDHVLPGVAIENYPSASSTFVTAGHRSHMEVVWCSE